MISLKLNIDIEVSDISPDPCYSVQRVLEQIVQRLKNGTMYLQAKGGNECVLCTFDEDNERYISPEFKMDMEGVLLDWLDFGDKVRINYDRITGDIFVSKARTTSVSVSKR